MGKMFMTLPSSQCLVESESFLHLFSLFSFNYKCGKARWVIIPHMISLIPTPSPAPQKNRQKDSHSGGGGGGGGGSHSPHDWPRTLIQKWIERVCFSDISVIDFFFYKGVSFYKDFFFFSFFSHHFLGTKKQKSYKHY